MRRIGGRGLSPSQSLVPHASFVPVSGIEGSLPCTHPCRTRARVSFRIDNEQGYAHARSGAGSCGGVAAVGAVVASFAEHKLRGGGRELR
mmetsp:Transcript_97/g.367  ORF Transcript_97/g.367 Transcript_97/m.367 type:complete len:90 (+) Transcript_97:711-980(+)